MLDWSTDPGTEQVTALLPAEASSEWIGHILRTAAQAGVSTPVSAVVGNGRAVEAAESAIRSVVFAAEPGASADLRSVMHRRILDGITRTTVTGTDPVQRWGGATAALAVHLAADGPSPLIAGIVERSGLPAVIRVSRGLRGGVPAVTWHVDAPGRTGMRVMEIVLDHAERGLRVDAGALASAREALAGDLYDHWRSPVGLARALTGYEVLGWDGQLVLDPRKSLDRPDATDVQRAISELLKPIAEVLGRS